MKEANKDTIRVSTLPAKYQKKLADRYGEVHPQDFLSGDKKTYFKFDGENKATGSVTHRPINMPSFESMYLIYSKLVGSVKYLAKNQEIADDKDARQLFDTIKTTYRQLQTYLRNERPEQYELMKMRRVMEENTYKEIIEVLAEEKPGLWANIRAKKARGAKPAHKNSNAHKDAVKAGKKINKSETKGAPSGHYFTKSGNLVKGTMSADAKERGARKSDPKDKMRSKVPKATQFKEASDPKDLKEEDFNNKGHIVARNLIGKLRATTFKEFNDDELEAFRKTIANAFDLKEGLWANINAKKKAGKKPSHGNSNAHKDAEAAGNKLKEGEHQGSNYKWPMSKATKDRKEGSEQDLKRGDQVTFKADPKAIWKILGIHGNTYRVNQQGERTMSYQPKPWLHNMIATGKATVV